MEGKKTFLENLRIKTKRPNIKKPRKKPIAKHSRNLAIRRSISVPDLTIFPGEAVSTESGALADPSDSVDFCDSPDLSDTDSLASSSVIEGPLFADTDLLSEVQHSIYPQNVPVSTSNRLSLPPAYEDMIFMKTSSPEGKRKALIEGISPLENKKSTENVRKFTFEPVKEPDSDQMERKSLPEEAPQTCRMSDTVASCLTRASSMGDEKRPHVEKKTVMFNTKKPLVEKLALQTSRPNSSAERLSLLDAQFDNADASSLYSPVVTPSEEQVTMPWSTNWEEEDLEPGSSSSLLREISMDEGLLDFENPDESLEENSAEACDDFDENIIETADGTDVVLPGPGVQTPSPFQRYLLSINLKCGRNLVAKSRRSGTSDPYVKFKLEGKQFYKSKVVYKDLNPRWNESFSHPLRDRDHDVELRVYDKNLTADEFMGSASISLKNLELFKTHELELSLEDPKSKEDDLGVIVVEVRLMFRDATVKRPPRFRPKKKQQQQNHCLSPRVSDPPKNQMKSPMWSGVLRITLVEGQDMPQYGQGDVYVRFRLSDQKYKSKNLCIQPNPQWREQFDFNQYVDVQEPLQVEVFSKRGRKAPESWGMFEVDVLRLPLNERQLYTNVLDPGKGKLIFLVTLKPCWGVSMSDADNPTLANQDEREAVMERYSLKNSHKCLQDVGFLQVSVLRANDLPATDINGKSNPFCVIELVNCKLQTHTIYRSTNPEWNKTFTFPIKDIHDVLELTVFDENGDRSPNLLGKVAVPLLTVQNGQQMCLLLKKEDLGRTAKGTITLVLEIIYNKVGASVKTFQPKEAKLIEENLKFNKKILARNIYRVRKISTAVLYTLQYIKSCFQWESKQRSLIAFLIFLVTVWHWELFMLPLFLLLLIGWNYIQLSREKASSNQDLVNMAIGDDEEEDEKEPGKKGLMDKIHMVQEVVLVVQNVLEEIANIGERVKNIFNWSVPFMSCLTCLVLFVAATLLYLIPLRYIVLVWGINKFTKKLRNPYCIDSNEILDFLQRVPSDIQKVQYSVLRAPTGQNPPRKKK